MIGGVVSFPAGWDSEAVRDVCGPEADDYDIGQCGVRWAYILATIGIFDAVILAALAFLLATRYVKIAPSEPLVPNGSIYKGGLGTLIDGWIYTTVITTYMDTTCMNIYYGIRATAYF